LAELSLNREFLIREPYRIITYSLLHADLKHLLFNLFALGLFGLIMERNLGAKLFLFTFFSGVILGGLAGSLVYPEQIGASAGIFAVIGVLAILYPKVLVPAFGMPLPLIVAAVAWIIVSLAGTLVVSTTAHLSHLVGLVLGLIVGVGIRVRAHLLNARFK